MRTWWKQDVGKIHTGHPEAATSTPRPPPAFLAMCINMVGNEGDGALR